MSQAAEKLPPGLILVATPIGNARDISLRALDVLRSADVLAAEDTRTLRHLMDIHGIPLSGRPLVAYHDHNGPRVRPRLLRDMRDGRSVAYASEAGTPGIADPGFVLVREARAAGIAVTAVPGATAAIAALTVSGLPTDRFMFCGFPPAAAGARRAFLSDLAGVQASLILYESPRRVGKTLADLCETFGGGRQVALCREMTKRFEEVLTGSLDDIAERVAQQPPKGEVVLIIDRPSGPAASVDIEAEVEKALQTMGVRDAAQAVAAAHGIPRKLAYQAALRLAGKP